MKESFRVALVGNPNTGKSTLFNLLTGLKQHTGNWAGKTVDWKTGEFTHKKHAYELVDLPGTYSLFSNSLDEKITRDFIIFEKPDVTIVILDATALERNMNLALQVMEMTDRLIICINLIDEAEKLGIIINEKVLMRRLGVPVIKISARNKWGISMLLDTMDRVVSGTIPCTPYQITYDEETEQKIEHLLPHVQKISGDQFPARWLAVRLLDGDKNLLEQIEKYIGSLEGRKDGFTFSEKT